jgi:glycerol-3-phosphate O-acyltransferase
MNLFKGVQQTYDPYNNVKDKRDFTTELGYRIVYTLNKGLVLTTTALVATILLTYRKGITYDDLISKVDWLREHVTLFTLHAHFTVIFINFSFENVS